MKCMTFGEIMMRLNPEGYYRFLQADRFEVSYAGGEANVAVSLANFGVEASFVTKLPDQALGHAAANAVRRYGVGIDDVVWGGRRLGVYFVERGASQRPSKVIYDRAASAIAEAERADFDWDAMLLGADWFHFTGITPALGAALPDICLDAVKAARAKGITVSCDLNYRANLWSRERAGEVMAALMPHVQVCIANEADAADVFGIRAAGSDVEAGRVEHAGYASVAQQLVDRFGFEKVAITLRGSLSASENTWAGLLLDAASGQAYLSDTYDIKIVDRVGGGDSFGGGLIYALMHGYDGQRAVDFATAASCLKHTIEHDFNVSTLSEVESLAAGNASGRIQR